MAYFGRDCSSLVDTTGHSGLGTYCYMYEISKLKLCQSYYLNEHSNIVGKMSKHFVHVNMISSI